MRRLPREPLVPTLSSKMPSSTPVPPRMKELHPSLLINTPKPKPFWRRSISFRSRSRKKSETPSTDSGVADLYPPPIYREYLPPEDEGIITDADPVSETARPGAQELPGYNEGNNTPNVRVTSVEVGIWSNEAYVTDDENTPKASYGDKLIEDTFGERLKERLQDLLERHESLAKPMEWMEERKRKRLSC